MNPFMQIHVTKEGAQIYLVSMEATHLMNMLNLVLVKAPARIVVEARQKAMAGFAPLKMTAKQATFLGLKELTPDELDLLDMRFQEIHNQLVNAAFEKMQAYILVGLVRDDTREGVLKLVQSVTGITGKVDIVPVDKSTLLLSSLNTWDTKESPFDDEDDEDDDWHPGHPSNYGDN